MNWNRLLRAGLLGLALSAPLAAPDASAQSVLRELTGATSDAITVSTNRAIVMEADRPFTELSVANPGIADIATLGEGRIYVLGKNPGRTTLTILGPEGEFISNVEVIVTPDVTELKQRLREILPGEPIDVRTAANGVILSGRVSGARKVSRALELAERYSPGGVTNLMMVGGSQQVMLKVRFAEMSRSVGKTLGTNLAATYNNGDVSASFTGPSGTPSLGGETSSGSFGLSLLDLGDFTVDILIEALEAKGMSRTLAEPNIVTVSGETGNFLAGGEIGVPVTNTDGSTTIEFKQFGVLLGFTPTVIDDDLIRLQLDTEVSSLGEITDGIPTLSNRSASTTVEMRDGQSFAIAGLLQDNFTDGASQIPWLGDVPVLGALFRSTSYNRRQSELVIIITPHLVSPTDGDLLTMPTDRMRIPSEMELFVDGKVQGSSVVQDVARQDFQGSYGYVME